MAVGLHSNIYFQKPVSDAIHEKLVTQAKEVYQDPSPSKQLESSAHKSVNQNKCEPKEVERQILNDVTGIQSDFAHQLTKQADNPEYQEKKSVLEIGSKYALCPYIRK